MYIALILSLAIFKIRMMRERAKASERLEAAGGRTGRIPPYLFISLPTGNLFVNINNEYE